MPGYRFGRPRMGRGFGGRRASPRARLLIALAVAGFALFTYFGSRQQNPVTGETQYVDLSPRQEIALGLQAAPQMMAQHGGEHADPRVQQIVDDIGNRIVARSGANRSDYPFEFHVLADERTVNAFALPGGQVFITMALLSKLETEGEVAGVLGHEVGHVVGRHGAEHMAKAKLTQGLTGAAVLATYDPENPATMQTAAVAQLIGRMINLKYGRDDELESDRLGVRFMSEAGYDPRSLIRVMDVLEEAGRGGQKPPEFFSTHPNPDRRRDRIREAIEAEFPDGIPAGLIP